MDTWNLLNLEVWFRHTLVLVQLQAVLAKQADEMAAVNPSACRPATWPAAHFRDAL